MSVKSYKRLLLRLRPGAVCRRFAGCPVHGWWIVDGNDVLAIDETSPRACWRRAYKREIATRAKRSAIVRQRLTRDRVLP